MKKILLIITVFLGGCFLLPENEEDKTIYLEKSNEKKIEDKDELVDIYSEEIEENESSTSIKKALKRAPKKIENFKYNIKYVARVLPVNVDGVEVQANDIIIKGNKAYVAYNYAGEEFRGAIQIIDITNSEAPDILEEILFKEMDINTLYLDGNSLIFGGAANPLIYEYKSFIGKINNLSNIDLNDIQESFRIFKRSHGITAISKKGSNYYLSAAAKNGVIYMTDGNFNKVSEIEKADVRDMEEYKNGVIALKGTTDNQEEAKILLLENDKVTKEQIIDNFSSDYHKATIEVYDNTYAFVALSSLGFKVYDISTDDLSESVFTLTNPEGNDDYLTNSVSYDDKKAFVAIGEFGVRIIDVKNIGNKNSDFGSNIGYINFTELQNEAGENYSANHVEFRSKSLFIASGVGGVNIYTVSDGEDD